MSTDLIISKIENKHWLSRVLNRQELDVVFGKSTLVTYRKRETIVKRGEFVLHLVLLLNGYAKIEIDEGKKNFVLDVIQGVDIVGLPIVLSLEKYMFSIVTLTDAEVVYIPLEAFKGLLESNGRLVHEVISSGNHNFVIPTLVKLISASQNNIRGRLVKLLLHLSKDIHKSHSFGLLISRSEIAQMIGFSRENVIRILTELNSEGIISVNGKSIDILDQDKLEDIARYS